MCAILESWRTSMLGKQLTPSEFSYYSGRLHRIGEVHEGAATMDFMEQERERGITITSASTLSIGKTVKSISSIPLATSTLQLKWSDPCAFSMALLLYLMRWQAFSRNLKLYGDKRTRYGVPRIAFVNKMDRVGADYFMCSQVHERKTRRQCSSCPMPDRL